MELVGPRIARLGTCAFDVKDCGRALFCSAFAVGVFLVSKVVLRQIFEVCA